MKRLIKYWWALVRCDTYLLFKGMWRGEMRSVVWHTDGRKTVAAVIGSYQYSNIKIVKVFLQEKSRADLQSDRPS